MKPNVPRETSARLEKFAALLLKWNQKINLIGRSTAPELVHRHIDDSLEVARAVPGVPDRWCDIGSGGGFPGIICAIFYAAGPTEFHLIECNQRKSEFLRTAVRELGLRATVHSARSEAVPPLSADVVSARALAPLPKLLELTFQHGGDNTLYLLPKGENYRPEIVAALRKWRFSSTVVPSKTKEGSVILQIRNVSHVG